MLPLFCLRLGLGLLASLLLLSPHQINPRFYRTQFLTVLGLGAVALAFLWTEASTPVLATLGGALVLCFLGSVSWSLEGHPGGRLLMVLALLSLLALLLPLPSLWLRAAEVHDPARAFLATARGPLWLTTVAPVVDDLTSALVLGLATTAMLMGHSYLIAPAMSITPLMRLLGGLTAALGIRLIVSAVALWFWTSTRGASTLSVESSLWLPVRWLVGFIAPLGLCWMAWQTARIRSTQSATGILYVAVIFCFLGELTSQLLWRETALPF